MTDIEKMREFCCWIIREFCWECSDPDGGSVQDKAADLGLIVAVPYDPEKHGESEWDLEPGDDWYIFADFLKSAPPPVSPQARE